MATIKVAGIVEIVNDVTIIYTIDNFFKRYNFQQ